MDSHKDSHEMTDGGYSLLSDSNEGTTKVPCLEMNDKNDSDPPIEIEIETEGQKPLIYRVNDNPPIHLTLIFALQQILLVMASPLSITLIIAEIVCMQSDEYLKLQVLSSIMFVTGLSTVLMSTIGVSGKMGTGHYLNIGDQNFHFFIIAWFNFNRLPIFQGGANSYIIPLLAMTTVKEWKCPATFLQFDDVTNKTIRMAYVDNETAIPSRDLAIGKINQLAGSLMAVGGLHFLIGVTGLVGYLIRFIGPITIVPTIVMIGLNIYKMVVKFIEPNMGISFTVIVCNLVLSLLLGKKQTPIPWWTKTKGFHVFWYPLHSVLSILISMLVGWILSAILTQAGVLTDNPEDIGYLARSDARNFIIEQSDWFIIPYPGKFGSFKLDPGVFANFLIASLLSVLDSIGDYAAAARTARVRTPPHYAFNRGIAVEGFMSFLAGTMGCCTATVSYGANIGAMGITRVVSRRVFQVLGMLFIICSVIGKIGAFFITIPYPVLGGITLITIGLFIGVVLSYLQTVDLSSTRNLAIVGISLLLGLVMPYWVKRNGDSIDTGSRSVDLIIQMLLANSSFVAGICSCGLDNIVPGTLRERGIIHQMKDLEEDEDEDDDIKNRSTYDEECREIYRLPFLPQSIRHSKIARRLLPIFDYEDPCEKENNDGDKK